MKIIDFNGKHFMLDAVDFSTVVIEDEAKLGNDLDAQVIRFRLDGTVFVASEDPDDYHSMLGSLLVYDTEQIAQMRNVFPPIEVVAKVTRTNTHPENQYYYDDSDWMLELIDVDTGKTVLEVGTDASEDYYPLFVASFHPENMSINAGV